MKCGLTESCELACRETFDIVRDKIVVEQVGAMNLYFTPNWRAVPDHDSFGHDVETPTCWWRLQLHWASQTMHAPGTPRAVWWIMHWNLAGTLNMAASTMPVALLESRLTPIKSGGRRPKDSTPLLLMHERFGKQTPRYWQAFVQQWNFIKQHQIDPVHGGWYPSVTREGSPPRARGKSDGWTEAYHQGRALINVSRTLRLLASAKPAH
jgi:mannobiose 2-epimerase